jgi:regulator of sigma E protease
MGVQPLGVAYPVLNRVRAVYPGSPADKAGLKPGDELTSAQFVAADEERKEKEKTEIGLRGKPIKLGDERNWLQVQERMQVSLPDTKLKIEYRRGDEQDSVEMLPDVPNRGDGWYMGQRGDKWYVTDRGIVLAGLREKHVANSWGEAFQLGLRNTGESLMLVFRFLRKLVTLKISPTHLGGPLTIFAVAGSEAEEGIPRLLLFLTLLSANLAIINFLPIPVLDGGHMLFLFYEAVMRKPVNEVWAMRLTVAGLIFILGLMVFVVGNEIFRFARMWML